MDIKMEGRNLDLGDELRERIQTRLDSLNDRFGPMTSARVTVSKNAHKNDQRAEATAVVNVLNSTITATKEAPTVVGAVNDTLDTLTREISTKVAKTKKNHR